MKPNDSRFVFGNEHEVAAKAILDYDPLKLISYYIVCVQLTGPSDWPESMLDHDYDKEVCLMLLDAVETLFGTRDVLAATDPHNRINITVLYTLGIIAENAPWKPALRLIESSRPEHVLVAQWDLYMRCEILKARARSNIK